MNKNLYFKSTLLNNNDHKIIQEFLRTKKNKKITISKHSRMITIGRNKRINRIHKFIKFEDFLIKLMDREKLEFEDIHLAIRLIEVLKKFSKTKVKLKIN